MRDGIIALDKQIDAIHKEIFVDSFTTGMYVMRKDKKRNPGEVRYMFIESRLESEVSDTAFIVSSVSRQPCKETGMDCIVFYNGVTHLCPLGLSEGEYTEISKEEYELEIAKAKKYIEENY